MKKKRERAVGARERAVKTRESEVGVREASAHTRESALSEREVLSRIREEMLRAREEAEQARAERERMLVQIRDANQNLVLATVRAHELVEQEAAARAHVAASEERFRSLVTASAAIVFRADAQGQVRVDQRRWREFTGLAAEDEAGQQSGDWIVAVHPDDREEVRAAWSRAIATAEVYTHQHRLRRKDGSYAWVVSRAVPISKGGLVREWIGMMTDISDRIRIEEAREQFIAILGHDLRNPLSAILMSGEALLTVDLPAEHEGTVTRILRSARRMEAMIRDLLDFARGRLGGGIPLRRKPCDVGRISADAVSETRRGHPGRTITFEATGDLCGDWDPDRLAQVLSNLLGNALQHGHDPIAVVADDDGDQVALSVKNQGPPIPRGEVPRLFEPFRRDKQDRTDGLGLGLYIVGEVVRAHGGTIAVSSSEGEGTCFTIRLPRQPPAPPPEPSSYAEEAGRYE